MPRFAESDRAAPASRPFMVWEGTLQTEVVQRIHQRYTDHLLRELLFFSHALQFIAVMSPAGAAAADLAQASTAVIDGLLATAKTDLAQRLAEQSARAQAAAIPLPGYTRARACRLELTSPRARQFIALLETADQLVQTLDGLWMSGDSAVTDLARVRALLSLITLMEPPIIG
jgi:hypothetical protein